MNCITLVKIRLSRFLTYCFYFLFEFSVLCFTWSSFYLSSEDIAKVSNVVIASFFQRFVPVQFGEFVVFIMTTVCFILRSCEPKPIDVPPLPEPELIDISMSPPLPVAEVHSTSFDNGEIYRPLLQPDDEMNTIVEIEPVEIPVPAIPIDLPDVPLELPIEPVEPYIIQALPSQVVSIEEYENTEPIIAEIVEITATEETEDLPVERQSSEETSFSGVPIMSKEVVDELSKTIKQHNEEHKLSNSSNTDDYTPENQK